MICLALLDKTFQVVGMEENAKLSYFVKYYMSILPTAKMVMSAIAKLKRKKFVDVCIPGFFTIM